MLAGLVRHQHGARDLGLRLIVHADPFRAQQRDLPTGFAPRLSAVSVTFKLPPGVTSALSV